ncbi:MAG: lysine 2,3-aminomutase [Desulfobacteraceae bacterium 4572_87]|nr:MAG: lysine 2,3-aminomutase [Desulfobacteraceae bacterium 4572_87]
MNGTSMEPDAPLWKRLLSKSTVTLNALPVDALPLASLDHRDPLERVISRYPMRINPYYLGLIEKKNDPIYRQCVPDMRELDPAGAVADPLNEEGDSPVFGLTHRYPDRVLLLVSSQCAMYCRFCNRKRKVGNPAMATDASIEQGIDYIRKHPEVRDVLLSGGDPLLLEDARLGEILSALHAIPHVEIIRIGTRVPCTLPQRVTPELTTLLQQFHPLYMNIHFNHPLEITPESSMACNRLADAGIPLGCQTVLLKGINDDVDTMGTLLRKLLTIRVKPYYLFHGDPAWGTSHFRTSVNRGLEIIRGLQGHTSGLCVPHFAIDLLGGGGKVPLLPNYLSERDGNSLRVTNYAGKSYRHPDGSDD